MLFKAEADINHKTSSGDTPLHWASADNKNAEIIKCLLSHGAELNSRDKYGWPPLHTACDRSSKPEVIEILLNAGADTELKAYYILFKPVFLLKHNRKLPDKNKKLLIKRMKNNK